VITKHVSGGLDDQSYFYTINVNFNVVEIQFFLEIDEIRMNSTCIILVMMRWRVDCWFNKKIIVNWKENIPPT
jgi:hypothetical protein